MNTQLKDNLLLHHGQKQDVTQSDDSEFSADMDVASELGSDQDRARNRVNVIGDAIEDEEEIGVSANGDIEELTQSRIDFTNQSYANERYTEKDIFSDDEEQQF